MKYVVISSVVIVLLFCSCRNSKTELAPTSKTEMNDTLATSHEKHITAEMAYEGVSNYCHQEYDWSVAEGNPSLMYVRMGEETDAEYQVEFRSYTGAFVYFHVDKASGKTRMVEYVPTLDVKNEAGTIDLFDYLEK